MRRSFSVALRSRRSSVLMAFKLFVVSAWWAMPVWWALPVQAQGTESAKVSDGATPTSAEMPLTPAERILRLEQSIAASTKMLEELNGKLNDKQVEYKEANTLFNRLDQRLKEREKAQKDGVSSATQPSIMTIDDLRKRREQAKERFDLAIQAQEAALKAYQNRKEMLALDQEALAKLRPASQPAASQPVEGQPPAGQPPTMSTPTSPSPTPPSGGLADATTGKTEAADKSETSEAVIEEKSAGGTPAVKAKDLVGLGKGLPSTVPGSPLPMASKPLLTDPKLLAKSKRLEAAAKKVYDKRAEADAAADNLKKFQDRIANRKKTIEDEEASLETIRGQVKNAEDCCRSSLQVVESLISSGAPAEQTNRAWERNDKNKELLAKAKAEVNETVAILDQMKSDLQVLEAEEKAALEVLKKAGAEVKKAEAELDDLNNPLSLQNLKDSAIERGPRLVVIVAGCLLLLWVARIIERRLVRIIAMGRNSEGTFMEREARARTLAYVFRSFAKTTIIIGGLLMFLTEIGINIVPLLGGAAVFGLAVAFGAQSLIKDYFNGFMILLENQYAINDEIKIGDVVGVVERISLRMTMLRDGCGAAHFMPHGEIHKVTNLTHGWSRAVFDIGVAYKENIDDVMAVLVELSREMRQDPTFGPFIIDNVEMQGVENLADSAVVIRFRIKTRPLRQGPVRREMLRRIKNRFDELGIEIPFPYRTLVVRQETGSGNGGPRLLPEDRLTS